MTTFSDKHPSKDAVCIDYGITNVMLPTVMLGSVAGFFFNMMLPEILIQAIITLLSLYIMVNSSYRYFEIIAKEKERDRKKLDKE